MNENSSKEIFMVKLLRRGIGHTNDPNRGKAYLGTLYKHQFLSKSVIKREGRW